MIEYFAIVASLNAIIIINKMPSCFENHEINFGQIPLIFKVTKILTTKS